MSKAYEASLDLIEIAPKAKPPVCKIIDYGKFKYECEKKVKESKKHQHRTKLKEIKFTPRISDHDYGYRCEQGKKFLKHGDTLKASVFFKGREMSYIDRGKDVLNKLISDLEGIGKVYKGINLQGRLLSVIITPDKK